MVLTLTSVCNLAMEVTPLMARVPSFRRVNSRANRTGLEAMDHGVLALIMYDLNYENRLKFLQ